MLSCQNEDVCPSTHLQALLMAVQSGTRMRLPLICCTARIRGKLEEAADMVGMPEQHAHYHGLEFPAMKSLKPVKKGQRVRRWLNFVDTLYEEEAVNVL